MFHFQNLLFIQETLKTLHKCKIIVCREAQQHREHKFRFENMAKRSTCKSRHMHGRIRRHQRYSEGSSIHRSRPSDVIAATTSHTGSIFFFFCYINKCYQLLIFYVSGKIETYNFFITLTIMFMFSSVRCLSNDEKHRVKDKDTILLWGPYDKSVIFLYLILIVSRR